MRLDESDLTPRQHRVYICIKSRMSTRAIAEHLGMPPALVDDVYAELEHMARLGGRRDGKTAHQVQVAIDARLAAMPVCGRCFLRGDHVCVGRASDLAQARTADPCDL